MRYCGILLKSVDSLIVEKNILGEHSVCNNPRTVDKVFVKFDIGITMLSTHANFG